MNAYRATPAAPALLRVGEVAAMLRISSDTVRRRIDDGTIRGVRFGNVIRVPIDELERVLEPTRSESLR